MFTTANHIKPEWHVRMQAGFQENNDSAISKTVNFANDATKEYVEDIYRLAFKLGCKGVTVYRDGSRDMQVLSTGSTAKKVAEQATASGKAEARADLAMSSMGSGPAAVEVREDVADVHGELAELRAENARLRSLVHDLEAENLQRRQKRSRPEMLRGTTRRIETPLGTLYVTITEDDRAQPFEVFMSLGKAGGALMADVEAMGRLISLALRSGIPMKEIYRQLRGISSDRTIGLGAEQGALGAGRRRHRDRALDAGQAGRPAGAAPRRPDGVGAGRGGLHRPARDGRGAAAEPRRHAGDALRRVPRLRLAARVRRGLREVPRVRVQRVRLRLIDRSPVLTTVPGSRTPADLPIGGRPRIGGRMRVSELTEPDAPAASFPPRSASASRKVRRACSSLASSVTCSCSTTRCCTGRSRVR